MRSEKKFHIGDVVRSKFSFKNENLKNKYSKAETSVTGIVIGYLCIDVPKRIPRHYIVFWNQESLSKIDSIISQASFWKIDYLHIDSKLILVSR